VTPESVPKSATERTRRTTKKKRQRRQATLDDYDAHDGVLESYDVLPAERE
jgi:hypothetical protein